MPNVVKYIVFTIVAKAVGMSRVYENIQGKFRTLLRILNRDLFSQNSHKICPSL